MSSNSFPRGVPFVDTKNMIDYRWAAVLNSLNAALPPSGAGHVTDGSTSTYGPMTLYQGLASARGGSPTNGSIYFALDTGEIFYAAGSSWHLLSEELTGDVTKDIGSNVTSLANVFGSPGTYGAANLTPILTVDAKGRLTGLAFEEVLATPAPAAGTEGSIQFNYGGAVAGSSAVFYNAVTGALTFTMPIRTFNNLSPLTTKGDVLSHNGTNNVRVPVGTNGQTLIADSSAANGIVWASNRTIDIAFQWNVTSVFPLLTVPANVIVKTVTTYIETAFDGTGATLTIGDAIDYGRLQDNINAYEAVGYQSTPANKYVADTAVNLYITSGTATQGSGLISIELQQR